MIRRINGNTIIYGDFNAHSVMWGSNRTNVRGERVEEWAAGLDLRLLNTGSEPTCVRPQGTSIIDLTWTTSDMLNLVGNWQVLVDTETLSDHKYVVIELGSDRESNERRCSRAHYPRWTWTKFDPDRFAASLIWECASLEQREGSMEEGTPDDGRAIFESVEEGIKWVGRAYKRTCDAAAPRIGSKPDRKHAYWWSDEIAALRAETISAQRKWTRAKR